MLQNVREVERDRTLGLELDASTSPEAPSRYLSPLRYPGAKAKLTAHIATMIDRSVGRGRLRRPLTLFEPFAGGASTSLRLLRDNVVDRAVIADADPLVSSFWIEAATRPAALIADARREYSDFVAGGGTAAVARWDYWRAWTPAEDADAASTRASLALKCLFLNRTTFSGILHGSAGPIGGRKQESDYAIGCRWNPKDLDRRIEWVGHLYSTGRLATPQEAGWQESLQRAALEESARPGHVIAYLDPPYVAKSGRLYKTSFSKRNEDPDLWQGIGPHQQLAEFLKCNAPFRWVLSYDDHPDLLNNVLLYGPLQTNPTAEARIQGAKQLHIQRRRIGLQHSASSQKKRRKTSELILTTLATSDCDGVGEPL